MAKIEDLIAQIPDERLKKAVGAEVKALKKTKKFGLVFEEHLPEMVRLPRLSVRVGELVALKREAGNQLWRVRHIAKSVATCDRAVEGYLLPKDSGKEFPIAELVVVRSFGDPIYPALVPVDRVARGGPNKPWHTLISADNFHALQLLLYCYEGQVDVIYIDPPYNTGARDWKYNNDYVDKTDTFRHSKWLSMMKKRLLLAKKLLKPEGFLVVAVDDCEIHHLRCLVENSTLFGPEHFIGCLSIRSKPSGAPSLNGFAGIHEYALFYRCGGTAKVKLQQRSEDQVDRFSERDETGSFWWENFRKAGAASMQGDRPRQHYPIWVSSGGDIEIPEGIWDSVKKVWKTPKVKKGWTEIYPEKNGEKKVWLWSPERSRLEMADLKVRMSEGVSNGIEIYHKRRLNRPGVVPKSMWVDSKYSASEYGTNLLKDIFGTTNPFSFPKSPYTVADCIRCACDDPNALIVDFFAGSGTTYHATALLNAEDGGNRRCILVTNNEVNEKLTKLLGADGLFDGDSDFEKHGICESITWPRCKYVTQGHRDDKTPLPGVYVDGREMRDGLEENLEYFRLDFLDPAQVARGDAFQAILPILWMMAGCQGEREDSKGSQSWFISKRSPLAVLIKEKEFRAFREQLSQRQDINRVFLVTDSEENFAVMRRALGRNYECVQLYKSYLENFRLNTQAALA